MAARDAGAHQNKTPHTRLAIALVAALPRRPILLGCGKRRHRLRHATVRAQRHKISQVSAAVCTWLQAGPSGVKPINRTCAENV